MREAAATMNGTGDPVAAVRLRRGSEEDAEAVAALIERENRRPADRAEIADLLRRSPSVVAHDGDDLVGFFYSRPFCPDILELRNMLVAASHRRGGLGTRIAQALEDDVRARGYRAVIGVNSWMHPGASRESAARARAFWLRRGWVVLFATEGSVVIAKWLGSRVAPAPAPAGTERPARPPELAAGA